MSLPRACLAILLAACALAAPAAELSPASDLRQDAPGGAALVLFSLPGCRYCQEVRTLHLQPLLQDARTKGRLAVLEVDMSSDAPLIDFSGERTTHRAFASRHGARIAPTVAGLRGDGGGTGEPIVGAKIPEFYGHYLDALVERVLAPQGRR